MNYELAKELKEAGFPVKTCTKDFCIEDGRTQVPNEKWHVPTLEELIIEACGKTWFILHHAEKEGWSAQCRYGGNTEDDFYSTPLEAVARLWLVLNKKDPQQS